MLGRTILACITSAITASFCLAQALPVRMVAVLPNSISETSGLICNGANSFWTHNDGGGQPEIYQIDTSGTILRTLFLLGANNVDWEDITQDDAGNIYIGDFGNNDNNRPDLAIYKIPPPSTLTSDSVVPEVITYDYTDQYAWPPHDTLKNFDMEAFVAYGDSLYLFSKNRTNPFDGWTKMYRLPQDSGYQVAELIDSFYTGPGPTLNYWICGAALSPGKDHLLLVSYARCFLFSCFEGADFFGGAAITRTWAFSQKEAAAWSDSTHIYLTDELLNGVLGGSLYEADMTVLVQEPNADLGPDMIFVGDTLILTAPSQVGGHYLWSNGATTSATSTTQSGSYWLQVTAPNGCIARDTVEVTFTTGVKNAQSYYLIAAPNPFDTSTRLQLQLPFSGNLSWRLLDLEGRVIEMSQTTFANAGNWEVQLGSKLQDGIYLFELLHDGRRIALKLLKQ